METATIVQMIEDDQLDARDAVILFEPEMNIPLLLRSIVKHNLGEHTLKDAFFYGIIHDNEAVVTFVQDITDSTYRNYINGFLSYGDEYLKTVAESITLAPLEASQTKMIKAFVDKYPDTMILGEPSNIADVQLNELHKLIGAQDRYKVKTLKEMRELFGKIEACEHVIHTRGDSRNYYNDDTNEVDISLQLEPESFIEYLEGEGLLNAYWRKKLKRIDTIEYNYMLRLGEKKGMELVQTSGTFINYKRYTKHVMIKELDEKFKGYMEHGYFTDVVLKNIDMKRVQQCKHIKRFKDGYKANDFILSVGQDILDGTSDGTEWNGK